MNVRAGPPLAAHPRTDRVPLRAAAYPGRMTSALDRPATARQVGAVHGAFRRLGLDDPAWRGARLAVVRALCGAPGIFSIRQLTGGEAGRLARLLSSCRDCRDLVVLVALAREEVEDAARRRIPHSGAGPAPAAAALSPSLMWAA